MSPPVLAHVTAGDRPFLSRLFCASRPELAGLPEPLRQLQFQAQALGYDAQFPGADHQLVLLEGRPVGRLLVHRSPGRIHLVDIALLPEAQGKGIGTALLQSLQAEAAQKALLLSLSVFAANPARRLYERLGFAPTVSQPPYIAMQWRPPAGGASPGPVPPGT
jgi:ribosomal protein S18 acetylase RimI-like enzyme